jgi:hypothetical protein
MTIGPSTWARRAKAQLLASQLATALTLPELEEHLGARELWLIERGAQELAGLVRDARAAAVRDRRGHLLVVK